MAKDEARLPQSPAAPSRALAPMPSPEAPRVLTFDRRRLEAGIVTSVCPMCGKNPVGGYGTFITPSRVPGWVFAAAAFSAWIGAFAWWLGRGRVRARLSLCDECVEAHERGLRWRGLGFGALALSPGPIFLAMPFLLPEMPAVIMLWSVASVAGLVACLAAFRRTRADVVRLAGAPSRDEVRLLVPSTFADVITQESPTALR